MTLSVVGYARVSTAQQAQGYSLDVQAAELRRYARQHGWKLREMFIEPGSSAKTSMRPSEGRRRPHAPALVRAFNEMVLET